MATQISEERIVRGACAQDCPDTCAFLYTVEDNKLVEVRGDPDHPMTRGGLCVKLKNYAEHHYNPDRLLHPMKRTGVGTVLCTRASNNPFFAYLCSHGSSPINY